MVEVVATEVFEEWFQALEREDAKRVAHVVELLRAMGVSLGHPYSSSIRGAAWPIRELRAQAGRGSLRVFYAFDPERRAVLLTGGDKSGDPRFYETMVKRAEALWVEFLRSLAAERAELPKKEEPR